jgi:lipopolysaccharide-induced tumor necrosis factor-alpha factor
MSKENPSAPPPPYQYVPPQAPPSYAQAVGGVPPSSPFTPQQRVLAVQQVVTTVVPIGHNSTHMICPSCHAEINSDVKKTPGLIAYVSGLLIALFGYV